MQSNHDIIEYYLFIAIFTDSPILINHLGKTWLHAYVWIICLEHMHKVQQRNRHEKKETLMHPSYPAHAMQFVGKTWKRQKTGKGREKPRKTDWYGNAILHEPDVMQSSKSVTTIGAVKEKEHVEKVKKGCLQASHGSPSSK